MSEEYLIYTLRPDNTALWLPSPVVEEIGATRGSRLTPEQFNSPPVKDWIAQQVKRQAEGRRR